MKYQLLWANIWNHMTFIQFMTGCVNIDTHDFPIKDSKIKEIMLGKQRFFYEMAKFQKKLIVFETIINISESKNNRVFYTIRFYWKMIGTDIQIFNFIQWQDHVGFIKINSLKKRFYEMKKENLETKFWSIQHLHEWK